MVFSQYTFSTIVSEGPSYAWISNFCTQINLPFHFPIKFLRCPYLMPRDNLTPNLPFLLSDSYEEGAPGTLCAVARGGFPTSGPIVCTSLGWVPKLFPRLLKTLSCTSCTLNTFLLSLSFFSCCAVRCLSLLRVFLSSSSRCLLWPHDLWPVPS